MTSRLKSWNIEGISAEAHYVQALIDEGIPREELEDEILRRHGTQPGEPEGAGRVLCTAILAEFRARDLLHMPKTRGYPPRIFVSYRRSTSEAKDRARRVATRLVNDGYDVIWDGFGDDLDDWKRLGAFYGEMALADIGVVMVSDDYYGADSSSMRDWLFEEFARLHRLHSMGLLELIYVLCDKASAYPLDNVSSDVAILDAREQDATELVSSFLGKYPGPRLSEQEDRELATEAASVIASCNTGNLNEAGQKVRSLRRHSDTEEFGLAWATYLHATGARESTIDAVFRVLRTNPSPVTTYELAELLWKADADHDAFQIFSDLAFRTSLWQRKAWFLMADVLRRKGALHAAANIYRAIINTKSPLALHEDTNDGALLYLLYTLVRIGESEVDEIARVMTRIQESGAVLHDPRAEELLKAARARLQSGSMPPPNPEHPCLHCGALYPLGQTVCMYCATIYAPQEDLIGDCGMCQRPKSTTTVTGSLPFCPSCKQTFGSIEETIDKLPKGLLAGCNLSFNGNRDASSWRIDLAPVLVGHREHLPRRYAPAANPRWWV